MLDVEPSMEDANSTHRFCVETNSTQLYQPSTTGTGNKEDRPRDGKTISTSTYNQTGPTETTTSDMTWLTAAEDARPHNKDD